MLTGTTELIRDINTQSVIRTIMQNGPISRAEVSAALGLTKATVSTIVQSLLDRRIVLEIPADRTCSPEAYFSEHKKGRRPIFLKINSVCGWIITLNISTSITLMASDLSGQELFLETYPMPPSDLTISDCLIGHINAAIERLPESPHGLLGICLGIHGVVHHNRIIFLPRGSYACLDLITPLHEHFGVPVLMENEANLSALAEHQYHNTGEMIFISVHNGIGIGIITHDQLMKGKHGFAGEFGHSIVQVRGRACPCGNRGCLEQYASERALFEDLSELKGYPVDETRFSELMAAHDPDAQRTIETFIDYMSIAVNNLMNAYNPDIIVLNCIFNRYCPNLCEQITEHMQNRMQPYCHLVPSRIPDTAVLKGGVHLIQKAFLYPNQL